MVADRRYSESPRWPKTNALSHCVIYIWRLFLMNFLRSHKIETYAVPSQPLNNVWISVKNRQQSGRAFEKFLFYQTDSIQTWTLLSKSLQYIFPFLKIYCKKEYKKHFTKLVWNEKSVAKKCKGRLFAIVRSYSSSIIPIFCLNRLYSLLFRQYFFL